VINEYFDSIDEWAEHFEEAIVERPSWSQKAGAFEPLRNIVVLPTEVVVSVDLPFTDEKSVRVKPVGKNAIEISANTRRKIRLEEFGVTHLEGEIHKFHAHLRIPVAVYMDKMHFRTKRGILEVHIPRKKK
jgi:HSP20 family molecular chaperone IbpA